MKAQRVISTPDMTYPVPFYQIALVYVEIPEVVTSKNPRRNRTLRPKCSRCCIPLPSWKQGFLKGATVKFLAFLPNNRTVSSSLNERKKWGKYFIGFRATCAINVVFIGFVLILGHKQSFLKKATVNSFSFLQQCAVPSSAAFGVTKVANYFIGFRDTSTLVTVHRKTPGYLCVYPIKKCAISKCIRGA